MVHSETLRIFGMTWRACDVVSFGLTTVMTAFIFSASALPVARPARSSSIWAAVASTSIALPSRLGRTPVIFAPLVLKLALRAATLTFLASFLSSFGSVLVSTCAVYVPLSSTPKLTHFRIRAPLSLTLFLSRVSTIPVAMRSAVALASWASAVVIAGSTGAVCRSTSTVSGASSSPRTASAASIAGPASDVRPSEPSRELEAVLGRGDERVDRVAVERARQALDVAGDRFHVEAHARFDARAAQRRACPGNHAVDRGPRAPHAERGIDKGIGVDVALDEIVRDLERPVRRVQLDGALADRLIFVGDARDRLLAREAGQLDIANPHAGQDFARVLLVVGVQGTRTKGQRGDQADKERDGEANCGARPAGGGRGLIGFERHV